MIQLLIACLWILGWLIFGAARAARKDGDDLVTDFGMLLPAFAASSCLVWIALAPGGAIVTHDIVLWVHHAAVFVLFGFLIAAQFMQIEAWHRRRTGTTSSVAATWRRLWILTEMVPGATAVTIFFTGLALLWQAPGLISRAWLQVLILAFGFFFFDGLLGFTPIIRRVRATWRRAGEERLTAIQVICPSVVDNAQLFLHFISWPFVFALGLLRPNWPNAVSDTIGQWADELSLILPQDLASVLLAIGIWGVAGLVIVIVRMMPPRDK